MDALRIAYDEVYVYAMSRPGFILQNVVDAFGVQSATQDSKPLGVVFGLIGLYLYVEHQFSGREVQKAHQELGHRKRDWPAVCWPENRGLLTVADVLAAPAGAERDKAIHDWCDCVWKAFSANRQKVIDLLKEYQIHFAT